MGVEYEFLQRVILSLGIGGLIGLEREYTGKQRTTGIRSFALIAFLGCITSLLSQPVLFALPYEFTYLPYIGFVMVVGYSFMVFYFLAEKKDRIGITTTLALPLTYLFGMMVGFGYFIESIIAALLVTLLLYSRRYSHMFVEKLSEEEIADALQFAIVLFIIYPLLPSAPITVFGVDILLRRLIEIIILFSLVSFVGFLAIRLAGTKAIPITGFFAGFVSSVGVVGNFANLSKKRGADPNSLSSGIFAANLASILSDALIIAVVSPLLVFSVAPPLAALLILLLAATLFFRSKAQKFKPNLGQPFSVIYAAKFGIAFFAITLAIELISHFGLGSAPYAIYLLSFLAGLVSVTPIAVSLAFEAGTVLSYGVASRALMLAIIAGMVAKMALLMFVASPQLRNKTVPVLLVSAAIGLAALFLTSG